MNFDKESKNAIIYDEDEFEGRLLVDSNFEKYDIADILKTAGEGNSKLKSICLLKAVKNISIEGNVLANFLVDCVRHIPKLERIHIRVPSIMSPWLYMMHISIMIPDVKSFKLNEKRKKNNIMSNNVNGNVTSSIQIKESEESTSVVKYMNDKLSKFKFHVELSFLSIFSIDREFSCKLEIKEAEEEEKKLKYSVAKTLSFENLHTLKLSFSSYVEKNTQQYLEDVEKIFDSHVNYNCDNLVVSIEGIELCILENLLSILARSLPNIRELTLISEVKSEIPIIDLRKKFQQISILNLRCNNYSVVRGFYLKQDNIDNVRLHIYDADCGKSILFNYLQNLSVLKIRDYNKRDLYGVKMFLSEKLGLIFTPLEKLNLTLHITNDLNGISDIVKEILIFLSKKTLVLNLTLKMNAYCDIEERFSNGIISSQLKVMVKESHVLHKVRLICKGPYSLMTSEYLSFPENRFLSTCGYENNHPKIKKMIFAFLFCLKYSFYPSIKIPATIKQKIFALIKKKQPTNLKERNISIRTNAQMKEMKTNNQKIILSLLCLRSLDLKFPATLKRIFLTKILNFLIQIIPLTVVDELRSNVNNIITRTNVGKKKRKRLN